jgi:hypothetical protein
LAKPGGAASAQQDHCSDGAFTVARRISKRSIETKLEKDFPMKKQRHLLAGTLLMSVMWAVPTFAQDYDLVINNGRVMDPETPV